MVYTFVHTSASLPSSREYHDGDVLRLQSSAETGISAYHFVKKSYHFV